jgi:hypothetical protein
VPVRLIVNGVANDITLNIENVILTPSETTNGRVVISVSSSHGSDATAEGMREFVPDLAAPLRQVGFLSWLPPIPRSSSTIMLGAFFRMAILMAADDPTMNAVHDQLLYYYRQKASGWLDISEQWRFDANCGQGYFVNHITFVMAYVYALLETDPVLQTRIRDRVLDGLMWRALSGHKNAYFGFLWAATRPATPDVSSSLAQLAQFQPGPRVRAPRDVRASYPHDASCIDGGPPTCSPTTAVDVADRTTDEFIWQRSPWVLYDSGDPRTVFSGVDFLAAYWAARAHGFLADDRPGVCARY